MHLEFLLENVNHVGTHNSPLFLKDDVTQQSGDLEESRQASGPLPCGLYLIASLPGASTRARSEQRGGLSASSSADGAGGGRSALGLDDRSQALPEAGLRELLLVRIVRFIRGGALHLACSTKDVLTLK